MDRVLRLGVLPTFGSRWLMPRLASFTHEYDDIELHLVRGLSRSDFARLRVDAAIECSPEAPSDLKAHRLVTEEILAVVTPEHYEEVTASGAVFTKKLGNATCGERGCQYS